MRRSSTLGTAALAAILALAAHGSPGASAEPPRGEIRESWGWLRASTAATDDVKVAPGLSPEEEAAGRAALPATVALAITRAGEAPVESAEANGSGFLVSPDGLVATNWHILAALRAFGGTPAWLWARLYAGTGEPERGRPPAPAGTGWMRAIPLGATWWGDVGLARLVTTRRDLPCVTFAAPTAPADRKPLGRRYVAVGSPMGRRNVVSAGALSAMVWFDPAAVGGRAEARRSGRSVSPSKGAALIGLHFAESLSMNGGSGSAVFDVSDGRCVGIVSAGDGSRPPAEMAFVRPASWIRPLIERVAADATWDPPDLGLRFGPDPAPPGVPVEIPDILKTVRKKNRGGAVVTGVSTTGPARGAIWEGDVVLEIGGIPVFGEVYESFAPALLALTPEVPIDVVLFRGGKRQPVQVVPRLGREIYGDFAAEHDARAGLLRLR